ncbi:MAG: hypothetical protein V1672_00805, partial [Candidatus Diapherotrites archaeon]
TSEVYDVPANASRTIHAILEPEIISGDVEIEFLGLYTDSGEIAAVLASSSEYIAKFKLRVPKNSDYDTIGAHIRSGTHSMMELDKFFIKKVNASGDSFVIQSTSYNPPAGYDLDNQHITSGDAKWASIQWDSFNTGITEFSVRLEVKENASEGDDIKLYYRGYGVTSDDKFKRDPYDSELQERENIPGKKHALYANTYEDIKQVGEETLCTEKFCYSANILDKDNDIVSTVEDSYSTKIFNDYVLRFTILNNSLFETDTYPNAQIRVINSEEAIKLTKYTFYDVGSQPHSGSVNSSETEWVNLGDLEPNNTISGVVNFTPIKVFSSPLIIQIKSLQRIIYEKSININTVATNEFEITTEPELLPSGVDNELKVTVFNKEDGLEVENADVKIKDRFLTEVARGNTNEIGIALINITPQKPGEKLKIVVDKPNYQTLEQEISVNDVVIELSPESVGLGLNVKTKLEDETDFTIKNLTEMDLTIKKIEIDGDFKGLLDDVKMQNWLYVYEDDKVLAEDSFDVIVKGFLSNLGTRITESETLNATINVEVSAFDEVWEFEIPLTVSIGIGDEVDDPSCFTITQREWTTSTEGKPVETEFEIKNNCTVEQTPVVLNNLRAKVMWESNNLGMFELRTPNYNRELRGGYSRIIAAEMGPEETINVVLTFTPNSGIDGEARATIVFEADNPTDSKKQTVSAELTATIASVNLLECVVVDPKVIYVNPEQTGKFTIETSGCGSETDIIIDSELGVNTENFTITGDDSKEIEVYAERNIPGQYPIYIYAKGEGSVTDKIIDTVKVRIASSGCLALSRYEFDIYDENPDDTFSGYDTVSIINRCYDKQVDITVDTKDWGAAMEDGLKLGLAGLVLGALKNPDYFKDMFDGGGNDGTPQNEGNRDTQNAGTISIGNCSTAQDCADQFGNGDCTQYECYDGHCGCVSPEETPICRNGKLEGSEECEANYTESCPEINSDYVGGTATCNMQDCTWNTLECIYPSGGNGDETPPATHNICQAGSCVSVTGAGTDGCTTNTECGGGGTAGGTGVNADIPETPTQSATGFVVLQIPAGTGGLGGVGGAGMDFMSGAINGVMGALNSDNPFTTAITMFVIGTIASYMQMETLDLTFVDLDLVYVPQMTPLGGLELFMPGNILGTAEVEEKGINIIDLNESYFESNTGQTAAGPSVGAVFTPYAANYTPQAGDVTNQQASTVNMLGTSIEIKDIAFDNDGVIQTDPYKPEFRILKITGDRSEYKTEYNKKIPEELTVTDSKEHTEKFHLQFNTFKPEEGGIAEKTRACRLGSKVGATGPNAIPRINFGWNFNDISADACDDVELGTGNVKDDYIYCDATQFSIDVLKKINILKTWLENNSSNLNCPSAAIAGTTKEQYLNENELDVAITKLEMRRDSTSNNNVKAFVTVKSNNTPASDIPVFVNIFDSMTGDLAGSCNTTAKSVGSVTAECTIEDLEEIENTLYEAQVEIVTNKLCSGCADNDNTNNFISTSFSFSSETGLEKCEPYNTSRIEEFIQGTRAKNAGALTDKEVDIAIRSVKFNAHLIKDGYTQDFREDFDDYMIIKGFLAADSFYRSTNNSPGLREFFVDPDHFKFNYYGAPHNSIDAGKYYVTINIEFDGPGWDFFDEQGNPEAIITVSMQELHAPEPESPFYYLPFDGLIGIDSENGRQGYGVNYIQDSPETLLITDSTNKQPIITTNIANSTPATGAWVNAKYEDDFEELNKNNRGVVLNVRKTGDETDIVFSPSFATEVEMTIDANKQRDAYVFYTIYTDNEAQSNMSNMLAWDGVSGLDAENNDFLGGSVLENYDSTYDKHGINAECTPLGGEDLTSYGFEWCDRKYSGSMTLETVVFTSQKKSSNMKVVAAADDAKLIINNSTVIIGNLTGTGDGKTAITSVEKVLEMVKEDKLCVIGSDSKVETQFFWNPEKVFDMTG